MLACYGTERIRVAIQREHKKTHVLIAKDENDTLVGTLVHDEKGSFGKYPYIHMIAVAPEFQNRGYGRRMLAEYEQNHDEAGMKYFLLVAEENERAKKLYENLGYKEIGRINGFYIKNQVEIMMMKSK